MSSIQVGQQCACFQRMTPICGNCIHEQRKRDEARDRTERSCAKHGWFVLMSATCKDHEYRIRGAK
jgi:hypothetical protein